MQIVEMNLGELRPYSNNPRNNDSAVGPVANSIKEFGFKVPIVATSDGEIINGHTRYKAAKKLGLEAVPVIIADDLSEEQVKAFRLADNKVGEFAEWDMELLNLEKIDFETIDMSQFGFELEVTGLDFGIDDVDETTASDDGDIEDSDKEFHRQIAINQYNLYDYDETRIAGKFNIPILEPVDHLPGKLQGFNYVLNKPDYVAGVHFFLDDYQFERIWQRPDFYIEKLVDFDCVLTPDFSLYLDMPVAMQVWNIYRSRLIGQIMQDYGIVVIPTVSWAYENSFEFCFDGLPQRSTLAISTIGVKQNKEQLEIWRKGVDEMIRQLSPKRLLVYGGKVDYDYQDVEVVYFDNATTERMKQGGKK
ncbi:DUF4417 domain-containing protein [Streptococcus cuniculi]|uniref:DUF4417 domain-containing protein n=1 Tax=Streptococcus cuniculi TaxID=1432788 RepID=A0A4Y9JA46_9STRE|nr:DUF4417 domain-containing protein [Streptococcus cuniculi]MBF0778168.1 DUF4417 domain-containing protein [Streptococcus cuniculi]TFU97910.1 DUF4417 domain-containing protein [Streptococcus cuniculi]